LRGGDPGPAAVAAGGDGLQCGAVFVERLYVTFPGFLVEIQFHADAGLGVA
jgi:hypothetical protein